MLSATLQRRLRRALAGDDDELSRFYLMLHHGREAAALDALDASGDYRWRILRHNVFGRLTDEEMEAAVDEGVRRMFGMLAEQLRRDL